MYIFPLLEFLSAIIDAAMIVLILSRNSRALLNRVGAALFCSFAIWAFADTFLNFSSEKSAAIFWNNITAFGWCSFASFYLWFTLILTKQEAIYKNKAFIALLLFLPALFVYQQVSGNLIADMQHEALGWSNIWSDSIWATLFYVYYISFTVISLALTFAYHRTSVKPKEKRQALLIFFSGVITLVVSSMTDLILPLLHIFLIPAIADITVLIWAGGITYAITRFDLMVLTPESAALDILSTMRDSVMLIDPDGRITEVNSATLTLLGYSRAEVLGSPADTLFFASDLPGYDVPPLKGKFLGKLMHEGFQSIVRLPFRSKDGKSIPLDISSSAMREKSGEIIGVVCVCRDMREELQAQEEKQNLQTELIRKQAEEKAIRSEMKERQIAEDALRESQTSLQRAVEEKEQLLTAISSLLIGMNASGLVTHWNEPAVLCFNLPAKKTIGKPFRSLPISWDWNVIDKQLDHCRSTRELTKLPRFTLTLPNGKHHILDLTFAPLSPSNWNGILILGTEITDQVAMQQHLEQRNKLESIGQLAAGIAHEINTPSQFIGSNLRFLRDQFPQIEAALNPLTSKAKPQPEIEKKLRTPNPHTADFLVAEFPKAIEQSIEGINRISSIVSALRTFSHPGSEKRSLTDLNKGLESTITVARNEWKYTAEIVTRFDPDLPLVECYSGELNQAFLNILINAVHAIKESAGENAEKKGLITVETLHTEEWAEIRIKDNGTGIPKAARSRIFDPFFTTKEVGRGTGQGLAICQMIVVQKHHGTIHFETEDGQGTTFFIRIPVHPPVAENDEETPSLS